MSEETSEQTSEHTAALLQALGGMVWMGDEMYYGNFDNLGSSDLGLGNNLGPGNDTINADIDVIHGAANRIEPGMGDETLYNDFENLGSSGNFGHSSNLGPGPGKFLDGNDTINADINIIHGAANHVMQGMGSPEDTTLDCSLMV